MIYKNEIWRDVIGYEGVYSISSCGRIRRDLSARNTKAGKILKLCKNKYGYLYVCLSKNNKTKNKLVHRLVAECFLNFSKLKNNVNHKDGNKLNNHVNNLEYVTHKENMEHASKTGLMATGKRNGVYTKTSSLVKGDRHYMTKIPDLAIPKIFELQKHGLLQKDIAYIYNVCQSHISEILCGKSRKIEIEVN